MRDVAATDPLIGVMVGSYKIERQIGAGGMGRVYAAVQPEVGSKVAIKVLNEEYAREPEVAERFFAEARAVNLIAHENIVSVLDLVHLPDGRPVIIMELLEGHTLRDLVRAGQPPIGAVVHVMIEVLSALAAAHGAGIVHRDCALCGPPASARPYCWVYSLFFQLGRAPSSSAPGYPAVEVELPRDAPFTEISSGEGHSCALTTTNKLYCWGDGHHGQLGDGGHDVNVPTALGARQ